MNKTEGTTISVSIIAAFIMLAYVVTQMAGCAENVGHGNDVTRQIEATEKTKRTDMVCTKDIQTSVALALLCKDSLKP